MQIPGLPAEYQVLADQLDGTDWPVLVNSRLLERLLRQVARTTQSGSVTWSIPFVAWLFPFDVVSSDHRMVSVDRRVVAGGKFDLRMFAGPVPVYSETVESDHPRAPIGSIDRLWPAEVGTEGEVWMCGAGTIDPLSLPLDRAGYGIAVDLAGSPTKTHADGPIVWPSGRVVGVRLTHFPTWSGARLAPKGPEL